MKQPPPPEYFEFKTRIARILFCSGQSAPCYTEDRESIPGEYWHSRAWRAWEFAGWFVDEMRRREAGNDEGDPDLNERIEARPLRSKP